jgi:hypothetical protein
MWIGMAVTSLQNALIAHAIAAPIIFAAASWSHYRRPRRTTPLQTAVVYVGIVILLDFVVVATLIERSYAMFASVLGTWLPFALIFAATYLVGLYAPRRDLAGRALSKAA